MCKGLKLESRDQQNFSNKLDNYFYNEINTNPGSLTYLGE